MYQNENEFEFGQQEYSQEAGNLGFEFNPEFMGETQGETFELSGELNETQEMELAHELLSVSNEQELNMFLGKLIKGAGRALGSVGRVIGPALKAVAKKALPIAGGALGTFFGGPLGGAIGGKLGSLAGNLFELELEGLSPEDQEFETARAYVRFAHSAARQAAGLQRRSPQADPRTLGQRALTQAAQQYAPGLLRPRDSRGRFVSANAPGPNGQPNGYGSDGGSVMSYASNGHGTYGGGAGHRAQSGTWTRRGRTLIIQL